jgi:protein arginine kinase activator
MTCDECGGDNPVVHLTVVENNETQTLHLCASCAEARGVHGNPVPENFLLAGVLAQLGGEGAGEGTSRKGSPTTSQPACPFCGLTLAGVQGNGPTRMSPLLVHLRSPAPAPAEPGPGRLQHVGKVYLPPDPSASEREKRLEGLRRKLDRAVELEDFERAADLRDQIRTLRKVAP